MLNFILQAGASVATLAASADSLSNTPVATGIQTAATTPEITTTEISYYVSNCLTISDKYLSCSRTFISDIKSIKEKRKPSVEFKRNDPQW
jgi:hypothetical protein